MVDVASIDIDDIAVWEPFRMFVLMKEVRKCERAWVVQSAIFGPQRQDATSFLGKRLLGSIFSAVSLAPVAAPGVFIL